MDSVLLKQLEAAKLASRSMMRVTTQDKNKALENISQALIEHCDEIILENQKDIEKAKINGMSPAMLDRLLLNKERIIAMANDVFKLTQLEDPIGQVIREIHRPNGLKIKQVRVPIGVFGIIYESRPNVTVDIACLCIKSSNVCVLKGGKEALFSNHILAQIMQDAIKGILPDGCIELIENNDRSIVHDLITAHDYIDVVVPRGGKGLIDFVVSNATVPVIETGAGNCHLYIDKEAELEKAMNITLNAKMQRPSVCNSIETLLVHQDVAHIFLPLLVKAFDGRVEIRGDEIVQKLIPCVCATEEDYATEYDDYIVAIKVVASVEEAIEHIYKYSTKHSEAIVTADEKTAKIFMDSLDSACVYLNASTRFSDGGEFGFGVELGISTQKLHARGPLGLVEMTSYQYKIYGDGQIRE
ncbi:MAG: glutamate-5-semialdehyde dehydrogenase [Longibaculum sp.]